MIGAGVDDDLHEAEERRLLDHVEHAQAEHRSTRNSAECTALRANTMPSAAEQRRAGRGSRT